MQSGAKVDSEQLPDNIERPSHAAQSTLRSSKPGTSSKARSLRPLLPRQIPKAVSKSLPIRLSRPPPRSVPQRPSGACGVPRCSKSPCNLVSHRHYARLIRNAVLNKSATSSQSDNLQRSTLSLPSPSSSQVSSTTTPAPETQFDVLPELPFEKPYPEEFRKIFHFFMTAVLDRLLLIFRPPLKVAAYKKDLLEHLQSSELFATVCLASSKFGMISRSDRRPTSLDRIATVIYSQLTKLIYNRLNDLQDPDIDGLLLCVGTLAIFDSMTLKQEVLAGHRRAIQQLVAARGGVHNLGRALPYVVQSDLTLAVMTGTYPAFSNPNRDLLPLLRKHPDHYGAMFTKDQLCTEFEPEVVLFCLETCHLIDLFERTRISYDLDNMCQGDPQLRPYFAFSRHQLGSEFAHMHAKYLQEKRRDWCMLVAAKIVEYPIVHGNYSWLFTEHLARELSQVLQDQDLAQEWHRTGRAFVWVLWVVVTAPVQHDIRSWAEETLFESIERRYGPRNLKSAKEWTDREWELCMSFVWSQEHLRTAFDKVVKRWNASTEPG